MSRERTIPITITQAPRQQSFPQQQASQNQNPTLSRKAQSQGSTSSSGSSQAMYNSQPTGVEVNGRASPYQQTGSSDMQGGNSSMYNGSNTSGGPFQIRVNASGSSPLPSEEKTRNVQFADSESVVQNDRPRPPLRKTSTFDDLGEKLIGMLDEIEHRVEHLRETAAVMEQEKECLMEMLNTVNMNKTLLNLQPGERDDIDATTDRLMRRCETVDVAVNTPRNPEQERSLTHVNEMVEQMLGKTSNDLNIAREQCRMFLNACSPDQPDGAIDPKFQSNVLGCTAEDQKKIRRRLEVILGHLDRADQSVHLAQNKMRSTVNVSVNQ